MKKILSLDGGGIRGVFSLEILERMECILREKSGRPDLILSDYFDFIGGTSTGAIIAASLSWGLSVAQIKKLYEDQCRMVFGKKLLFDRLWRKKYSPLVLSRLLQELFSEDGAGREPALMMSKKLKTLLLIMMRNGATGSPWPVTNNPKAMFNDLSRPDCNLRIPLWQLIRGSTAAPTFFPPEEIELGGKKHIFVDGAITPYNNPAFFMFLNATLPCYNLGWETGQDKMLLISVGTGRFRVKFKKDRAAKVNILDQVPDALLGLIDTSAQFQDQICRVAGHCVAGEPIDSEIGVLHGGLDEWPRTKYFNYARYNREFLAEELQRQGVDSAVDNIAGYEFFRSAGKNYAAEAVKPAHLPWNEAAQYPVRSY